MSDLTGRIRELFSDFKGKVVYRAPLCHYTSLKVGGPADALFFPSGMAELQLILDRVKKNKIPLFTLGAGSNLIVRDGGIRGAVIKLGSFNRIEKTGADRISAESGVPLSRLLRFSLEQSLTGFEFLCSIPGSVGGALKMNAGIPDHEISDCVESVQMLTAKGDLLDIAKKDAGFGYRSSRFPDGILLSGRFRLAEAPRPVIRENITRYLRWRKERQPLAFPNAGSIFKNPAGHFAGKLIESVGLKGYRIGGAQISEKHANFIINRGSATASDILKLVRKAGKEVEARTGIVLELEARIVGEYAAH